MPWNSPGILEVRDEYRYFSCAGSKFVQLNVIEQPVDVGFGIFSGNSGPQAAIFGEGNDQTLFPGSNPIPQVCDCVRYKNHTRGVSGRITIAARIDSDLPEGIELSTSYVPSYFTITPEGRIEATFEGHIRARGLDLPTGVELSPNPNNEPRPVVQWLRNGERERLGWPDAFVWAGHSGTTTQFSEGLLIGGGAHPKTIYSSEEGASLIEFIQVILGTNLGRTYLLLHEERTTRRIRSSWLPFSEGSQETHVKIGTVEVPFALGTGVGATFEIGRNYRTEMSFAQVCLGREPASPFIIRRVTTAAIERVGIVAENPGAAQTIQMKYLVIGK